MAILREILQRIVTPYNFSADDLELISISQNYVYKATKDEESVIVRISTGRHRTLAQTEAELSWIARLVKNNVRAPMPIPTSDGHLCHEEVFEGISYVVTCFEHAEGVSLPRKESGLKDFEKLGAVTGRLHKISSLDDSYGNRIDRPMWYNSRLLNNDFKELGDILSDELKDGVNRLIAEIKSIPMDSSSFGLIHGDLNFGNLYRSKGEIILIDFDNCEYGYYLQDLAVILYDAIYFKSLIEFPNQDLNETMKKYWDPLLKGYLQTSPLKQIDAHSLKKFFLLREAVLLVYFYRILTEEQKDDTFHKAQDKKIENIINQTHQVDLLSWV